MPRIKKYIRFAGLVTLIFAVIFCSACSFSDGVNKVSVGKINSNHANSDFRIYDKSVSERVLSGGSCALYFDKNSGGISFYNNEASEEFQSLPAFSNSFAASFIVSIFDGSDIHYLDSSFHCAGNGGITYENGKDALTVTYEMKKNDISLVLPVKFTLRETFLDVNISLSECVLSEGETLLSVSVLPYLGAIRYDSTEIDYSVFSDFYLTPDGAGALIYTAFEDENESLIYSVYGKEHYEETIPCQLGAYGIKQKNSALAVTITKGCENALINMKRSNADDERMNRIYPEFIITPVSGEKGDVKIGESFCGEIAVSYEMLSYDSADYIGIATSVRQTLIKSGLMNSDTCESVYPLFLTVTGSVDGSKKETVTSFQQTENLLSILKGKGINNINMILEGFFSGGKKASAAEKIRISSAVGSKNDLRELLSYASTQNLNVYAGVNFLTSSGFTGISKGLFSEKEFTAKNELYPYIGDESIRLKFIDADKLSRSANNAVLLVSYHDFAGVTLLDSAYSVIEDLSQKGDCYKGYSDKLSSALSTVSSKTSVMLRGSSFNMLKTADYIDSLSFDVKGAATDYYKAVPFVPAVLHGSVIYSSAPANTDAFPRIMMLRAVEYGAALSYLWNFSEASDKYYENTLTDAVDFYLRAEKDLAELASKRIIEHFLYEDGVYCTGYDGGVRVYVNYNNYSVIIGDVAVMPYDYLRIG